MKEEWKTVRTSSDRWGNVRWVYEISNLGRCRKNGEIVQPVYTRTGYVEFIRKFVHRLVYENFVGPVPEGKEIDHINTVRDDNRLENLRCVTRTENMNNPITKEHLRKAMMGNTINKGRVHTEESRKHMSEAHKGKATWNKGKKNCYSEETLRKMSFSAKHRKR